MGLGLPLWGLFVVGLGFACDGRGHGLLFFFFLVVGLLVALMVDLWVGGGGGVKCV